MIIPWQEFEIIPSVIIKIDSEDKIRIREKTWRKVFRESGTGYYFVLAGRRRTDPQAISLARFILEAQPGKFVKFKSLDDPTDYRKSNLFLCDRRELGIFSRSSKKNCSSVYRGVSYFPKTGRWKAEIRPSGQRFFLGYFATEREAAIAYNEAALKHFGPNAQQNKI